jgi:hypothetical protein
MKKSARRCLCGRIALSSLRGRWWKFRRDHPLCRRCFETQIEKWRKHEMENRNIQPSIGELQKLLDTVPQNARTFPILAQADQVILLAQIRDALLDLVAIGEEGNQRKIDSGK